MNEETETLLRQFIPEARDLLEQAGSSLLALERDPGAAEPLNALFRAVHTLKGTSGLFAVEPLTRLVHAGEDVLFAVQAGHLRLAAELTDALLESLDQVGVWIEALADSSALPGDAEAASARGVVRLRAMLGGASGAAANGAQEGSAVGAALPVWLAGMAPGAGGAGLLAIRYSPDAHCFFRGEDPLGLVRQLPGLRALRVDPVEAWPSLAEIDPFVCNICLRAIVQAPRGDIEQLLRYALDQVEIVALPPGWPNDDSAGVQAIFRAVLDGQRRLLRAAGEPETANGRLEAAVRALRGALAYAGRNDRGPALEEAAEASRRLGDGRQLLAWIDMFAGGAVQDAAEMAARPAAGAGRQAPAMAPTPGPHPAASQPATLRVEQAKIDVLMNLIGELVVAKNAIAYLARCAEQGQLSTGELAREIKARHALVNRIAEDMQGAVMSVRMLPVEQVFQRFPRLVRDVSRRLGKRVELVVEGGDTEADKNIIEAIADPLIHMVRNSLDHGIEMPEVRRQAGKPEHGTLRLTAVQDNDEVFIRVIDDGRGIDPAGVRRRAVEQGMIDAERARALSDEEAVALVFAPGFSTAPEVSDLSGRGVGMDVVRAAVEKVGGRVSIASRIGIGTTVELVLPLSLAVTRIMTVCCGEGLFGVPMSLVVETVRVPRAALHRFRDREAFILRDSVVPVLRLAALLELPVEADEPEEEAILVVRVNGERLGLVVGAFREGMEAIVKPMEGVLADMRAFSGTTLLGDGRVLLVLDLRELVA
jgi:two-component system chemotaxis sensor kinase CheA